MTECSMLIADNLISTATDDERSMNGWFTRFNDMYRENPLLKWR